MIIYNNPDKGNKLERVHKGPRRSRYTATVSGWYAGGISARSDTEALEIYKRIISAEEAATV